LGERLDRTQEVAGSSPASSTSGGAAHTIEVKNNLDEHRFEIWVGDELAGFTVYARRSGLIDFLHTEIDRGFRGRGLGHQLIATALSFARENSLAVRPFCPYVRAFIAENPGFLDLVPEHERAGFRL
jgi:uncharacterized protein